MTEADIAREFELERYCATDAAHEYPPRPFSAGDYTYATDGCIAIRVPRHPDVPENDAALVAVLEKAFASPPETTPAPITSLPAIPGGTKEECFDCEGSGHKHYCPDCECECETCNGAGQIEYAKPVPAGLRGAVFNLEYVHMLAQLPSLSLPVAAAREDPMYFRFDGGDGVLMPMRYDAKIYIAA